MIRRILLAAAVALGLPFAIGFGPASDVPSAFAGVTPTSSSSTTTTTDPCENPEFAESHPEECPQEETTTTSSSTTTTAAPTTTTTTTTTTAPPTGTVSDDNPAPGDDVDITATGFGPNTDSTIFILSTPIQLATATADSNGVVRATVTIPEDIQPGAHTIEVRGVDSNETPRTVSIPITVAGEVTGTTAAAQPLAATGSGLSTLVLVAGVLAAAGGALLLQVRRRA